MSTDTKAKHTPGPWRQEVWRDEPYDPFVLELLDGDNHTVLSRETLEETVANARLIAAAPELLAALKAMLALVPRDKLHPFGYTEEPQDKANDLAREAIRKAEGNA